MTVVDRVQYNVLMNPYAGTNRGPAEPIDSWMPRAQIACYSCGACAIGGQMDSGYWLCPQCLRRYKEETGGTA